MFRALLVPILIAGLLVCPLRCTAGATVAPLDRAVTQNAASEIARPQLAAATGGCSCCVPPSSTRAVANEAVASEAKADHVPADCPAEDCGCSSCICSGAILQCDGDLLQAALGDVLGVQILWVSDTDPAECIAVSLADFCPPHSKLLNGRAARIAHQSLLI